MLKNFFQQSTIKNNQSAFTLMEVVVASSIFAGTITLMMVLFTYTLRIQRRTEALRQVSQSVRSFAEFISKEVRNGQVDYSVKDGQFLLPSVSPCPAPSGPTETTYANPSEALGLINVNEERECIYLQDNDIYIKKEYLTEADQINPNNVNVTSLKFYVRPSRDPYSYNSLVNLVEVQPSVTIMLTAEVVLGTGETKQVQYQTSVSSAVYNIPHD